MLFTVSCRCHSFRAAVFVGAERLGTDIAAAGVGDDGVRKSRHAQIETPALDRREPEVSRRREDAYAVGNCLPSRPVVTSCFAG